jgi:hypothetical protein
LAADFATARHANEIERSLLLLGFLFPGAVVCTIKCFNSCCLFLIFKVLEAKISAKRRMQALRKVSFTKYVRFDVEAKVLSNLKIRVLKGVS